MNDHPRAVLLLAYGTPETVQDVEPYFTHIRGGRRPSPEAVEKLEARYAVVGGRTPLLDITRRTAEALQRAIQTGEPGARVYIGMKHWHPYIADVVPRMAAEGVRAATVVVLAPHYSRASIGGYRAAVDAANATLPSPIDFAFVDSWHLQPEFIEMMAALVAEGLSRFSGVARDDIVTVFSAHSLPERIRTWADPYEAQLLASSQAVAARLGLTNWRFAWQSAGETGEPWIGPDIGEMMAVLHREGARRVLSVPIGFLADHLEIMYDLDLEAARVAAALGIEYRRTTMPNDSPALVQTLEAVVAGVALRPASVPS